MATNYTPYGFHWQTEMMKFNKKELIELLKKQLLSPSSMEKMAYQLFIGKVSDVIGIEKTAALLKESNDAVNEKVTFNNGK